MHCFQNILSVLLCLIVTGGKHLLYLLLDTRTNARIPRWTTYLPSLTAHYGGTWGVEIELQPVVGGSRTQAPGVQ